jgi:ComF family protein
MKVYASALAGFVWPKMCPGCGCRLAASVWPACPSCLRKAERIEPEALVISLSERGLDVARWRKVFALWVFDKHGLVQTLHHSWKYRGNTALGNKLGFWLGTELIRQNVLDPLSARREVLVPIPLSQVRMLERGYNQSVLLCQGIASATGQQLVTHVLKRSRFTRSQVGLSFENRRHNVRDAFTLCDLSSVNGRHVWLVDDVITTGATLWAASEPFQRTSAESVSLLTLSAARTV